MQKYKYLIIGGGMTADAAVGGIREIDAEGSIGLMSAELDPPYDRPPLTKGLWKDKTLGSIWRHTEKNRADLHLGHTATAIDVQQRTVRDDQDETYSFEKLLLATGGSPRRLPFGQGVIYYRTVRDYLRLQELTAKPSRLAVIGAGFIGSEIAASLATNRHQVVLIFPGTGICSRMFPAELSQFITEVYRQKGVEVWNQEEVATLDKRGHEWIVGTKTGRETIVDGVIAGLGIEPNVDLAKAAGLHTQDGIVVDELLRTSHSDIYAAGDVARFDSPALERQLRVEHEDNANTMGRIAGRNMAGHAEPYRHLPFFYSDLFEFGYEAVGELDSRLSTLADWKTPCQEGVVYYQKDGRVRGVLLWNVWGQVDAARELIAAKRSFRPEELKHKLPKAA